eukprot:364254-Chlamydomonas_euryale.AAC.6
MQPFRYDAVVAARRPALFIPTSARAAHAASRAPIMHAMQTALTACDVPAPDASFWPSKDFAYSQPVPPAGYRARLPMHPARRAPSCRRRLPLPRPLMASSWHTTWRWSHSEYHRCMRRFNRTVSGPSSRHDLGQLLDRIWSATLTWYGFFMSLAVRAPNAVHVRAIFIRKEYAICRAAWGHIVHAGAARN